MARGGVRLSRFAFKYQPPAPKGLETVEPLEFEVVPESSPPTNIHVLIGRNGVGKTHLLNSMQESLLGLKDATRCGCFQLGSRGCVGFANLVSVSFSAFDEFELIANRRGDSTQIGYAYVGLKRTTSRGAEVGTPKSPEMLTREFVKSLRESLVGSRRARWESAIATLQTDPVFRDADVASFSSCDADELESTASGIFRRLSSGHKIILLTTTRLVELTEERTLVMLDEPEAHLHPPLLSAFIRALSDLLIDRNGVALVATHSPVVLQEVPMSCVWVLQRHGRLTSAERPSVETFGENVGVLTREVFGLEVTHSGFHKLLDQAVARRGDYAAVLKDYDQQLGAEARAIVRALLVNQEDGAES
jgi:hypothetical protein